MNLPYYTALSAVLGGQRKYFDYLHVLPTIPFIFGGGEWVRHRKRHGTEWRGASVFVGGDPWSRKNAKNSTGPAKQKSPK